MKKIKNQVRLIGNVGALPVLKTLDEGRIMLRFSLATNDSYRDNKGEMVQVTDWHNVVAFGKTAELAGKHLDKGKTVAVEGKLKNRSWEENGEKKYITEVIMSEYFILTKKEVDEVEKVG